MSIVLDGLLEELVRKQNLQDQFLRQIANDIAEMNNKLIRSKDVPVNPQLRVQSIFKKINLPADSEEEMLCLEQYLSSEDNFNMAVGEVQQLGGNSLYGFLQRALTLFITNRMASNYSWYGKRLKQPFKGLNFARLLISKLIYHL
ncbi:hypothetical protein NQ315_003482 [Exocentrus adspersus]|uniref:DUF4806 domain-containing protein n=1 Tax=Exocentrus adspersus TaxID=1586481 RepID=A0AAV8V5T0_9CUCU|nr:hypothetical protein NQ315_003482 [Exocentrus adspersus]